jgi:hypothetical protein
LDASINKRVWFSYGRGWNIHDVWNSEHYLIFLLIKPMNAASKGRRGPHKLFRGNQSQFTNGEMATNSPDQMIRNPTGYDPNDSTKLIYGDNQQHPTYGADGEINSEYTRSMGTKFGSAAGQPGEITGLTAAVPGSSQALPLASYNGPGATSAFAPSGQSQSDIINRINRGLPPPSSFQKSTSFAIGGSLGPGGVPIPGSSQIESTNPLTGGKSPAPTGKTQTVSSTPATPNSGGVITRGNGDFAQLNPDAGYKGPKATLGASDTIDHGRALGFSSRGGAMPQSTDTNAPSFTGGTGAFQRAFSNPGSAQIYHSFVQNLFGSQNGGGGGGAAPSTGMTRTPSGAGQGALSP